MDPKKKLGVFGPRDPNILARETKLIGGPQDGLELMVKLDRVSPVRIPDFEGESVYLPWRVLGTIVWAWDELSHQEILELLAR